jgi:hypothetical protein
MAAVLLTISMCVRTEAYSRVGDHPEGPVALLEAMKVAILAVNARDAEGFFEHCGYRQPAQLL